MQAKYLSATALAVVFIAAAGIGAMGKPPAAPTPAEAVAFVAKAEADLAKESEGTQNHAAWVRSVPYINSDTNWLVARANSEGTDMAVRYAKGAARFDHVKVDDVTRRKLYLLKQGLVLPASDKPGARRRSWPTSPRSSTATIRPPSSSTRARR